MAKVIDPTPEQEAGYRDWLASRPDAVRRVAERFDPWSLYLLRPSNQRVTVLSFGEQDDGTVTLTVRVSADFNVVLFERDVFGVAPDDLEPCDPPPPEETTGAVLSQEDVTENLDALRLIVRPDLWERGPDGTAVWRGSAKGA